MPFGMFFGSVRPFEKRSVLTPDVYPEASTNLTPYCDVWLNNVYKPSVSGPKSPYNITYIIYTQVSIDISRIMYTFYQ